MVKYMSAHDVRFVIDTSFTQMAKKFRASLQDEHRSREDWAVLAYDSGPGC